MFTNIFSYNYEYIFPISIAVKPFFLSILIQEYKGVNTMNPGDSSILFCAPCMKLNLTWIYHCDYMHVFKIQCERIHQKEAHTEAEHSMFFDIRNCYCQILTIYRSIPVAIRLQKI